jgi:pSer/pThr/pTyr-binding forkhead associated (FHA) protein
MGILDKTRTLESRIARAVNQAAESAVGTSGESVPEPLEVAHAIVDVVDRQIQSGSRGTRLFPYNRVEVSVLAASRDLRPRFEALFAAKPSLRDRIVDRLQCSGCDATHLDVAVTYVSRPARSWNNAHFDVKFDRVEPLRRPPEPIETKRSRVEVTVLQGDSEQRTYSFAMSRIDFGRGVEVRDYRHRLLRANHVVFVEGCTGVNQTISRQHAHIAVDASSGEYRVHDDRSVHGTGVVRGGRTIPVPPGSRGVRLCSGDEIVLGEARVRLRLLSGNGEHRENGITRSNGGTEDERRARK